MPIHFEVSPGGLPVISASDSRSLALHAASTAAGQIDTLLRTLMKEQQRSSTQFAHLFEALAPRMESLLSVCSNVTFDDLSHDDGERLLDVVYGEGNWLIGDAFEPPPAPGEPEREPAVMPPDIPVSTAGRKPRARAAEAVPA